VPKADSRYRLMNENAKEKESKADEENRGENAFCQIAPAGLHTYGKAPKSD
jgi:hypothetical protein